jgi:PilZ domain
MSEGISKSSPDRSANTLEASNRRRSERVVLRVPVQLSAKMTDGKRICIEVYTLVVNAHGGLLDVGMEMLAGQPVLLSNLKTEKVATAKVVRVKGSGEGRFSVAVEFEFPAPSFWPVSFPPPDWSSVGIGA